MNATTNYNKWNTSNFELLFFSSVIVAPVVMALFTLENALVNYVLFFFSLFFAFKKNTEYLIFTFIITLSAAASGNMLATPIGNFSLIEVTVITLFFHRLCAKGIKINIDIYLLLIASIGAAYASYISLTVYQIPKWSLYVRVPFLFLPLFLGPFFLSKIKSNLIPFYLSSSIIICFLWSFIFNYHSHVSFLLLSAIPICIYYNKLAIIAALIAILLLSQEWVTFTMQLTFLLTSALLITRYYKIKKIFFTSPKKVLFFVIFSFSTLLFIASPYLYKFYYKSGGLAASYFSQSFTEKLIWKFGDRVMFWVPFGYEVYLSPFTIKAGKALIIPNLFATAVNSPTMKWDIHPHNIILTLLYDYGIIFGLVFLTIISKTMLRAAKQLDVINQENIKYVATVFFLSSIPVSLFGYDLIDYNFGYYYWIMAGIALSDFSKKSQYKLI